MRTLTLTLTTLLLLAITTHAQNELELVWTGYGEAVDNYFGFGITGGDFNDDSYSDVLLGAWGWNYSGGYGQGKACLYLGGPDFFIETTYTFVGDSATANFGYELCNIQDVNGDDVADFLIAAPERYTGGYSEVFFGGEELDTLPDWRVKKWTCSYAEFFGFSSDSVGDVNGDGWSDFIISGGAAYEDSTYLEIYFGGPQLDTIPDWRYFSNLHEFYLFRVAGLGDINGDGFDDVLAYKPTPPTYPGQIFFGGSPMDTIPDLEFHPSVVAGGGIGDINDDGYNDFALDKYHPELDSAYAVVYFGGADVDTIFDVALSGQFYPRVASEHGFSHADVNGDGISDLVCDGESIYFEVFLGSPWFNGIPDWWYTEFWMIDGYSLAGVGDVNNDGCDEIMLSLPDYNFEQGKAYLFAGNPNLVDYGAGIEPGDLQQTPGWFALDQNYPNPFNTSTTMHFELGKISVVSLTIYDLQGQRIRQLIVAEEMNPGGYNISWRGINEYDQPVASGIYLLEMQVDEFREIRKMVLLR
jgi:hypothetical protein